MLKFPKPALVNETNIPEGHPVVTHTDSKLCQNEYRQHGKHDKAVPSSSTICSVHTRPNAAFCLHLCYLFGLRPLQWTLQSAMFVIT